MKEMLRHIALYDTVGWHRACPYTCWGLLLTMFLLGCSDDPELDNRQTVTFEAQPSATEFVQEDGTSDARPVETMGVTRAWTPPDGYYLYDAPDAATITNNAVYRLFLEQKNMFYKSIEVFFTRNGNDPQNGTFTYKTSDSKWHLNMDIPETGYYYVYGYIPKEVANDATIAGNSSGAVLTIEGIKTVTHSDVCVIVGAKEGQVDGVTGLTTGQFAVNAQQAQIGSSAGGHNYIYLLFDHLYSALAFNFTIDATYNDLRTIKLRKLELIGYADANETNIKARYNIEIKLKSNTTGTSPIEEVTFTPDPTSGDLAFEPIYEYKTADPEIVLNPVTPTAFLGCFVPGQNTYFKLRSTYDVFDKEGNLIRKGCIADNTINLKEKFDTYSTLRGQMFQITLKVQPTYLYVLSEPDLDNPTLKEN